MSLNIKKLLGARISSLRKLHGYTQMQFAEMIGISTNALGIIETGNGFLTSETLEKILSSLNISPEELFSFGGIKTNEEIYYNILKNIEIIKNDRHKLNALDCIVKNLV
ncbi:helix-turn-helix transcriptional regulator [bacterium]|nr:helix-turn-helix transcriptional regulator [bacterium]